MSTTKPTQRRPHSALTEPGQVQLSVGGARRPPISTYEPTNNGPSPPCSCRTCLIFLMVLASFIAYLFLYMNLYAFMFGVTPYLSPAWQSPCAQVHGAPGAEDFVYDPRSKLVLLSSADHRTLLANHLSGGHIYTLDTESQQVKQLEIHGFDEALLHPHGIDLYVPSDASLKPVLFIVNHRDVDGDAILRFEFDAASNSLVFLSQTRDPKFTSVNDVAAIDREQFYATNDNGAVRKTLRSALGIFVPALGGSSVVHYDGKRVNFAVNPGDARMANGIALSHDRKFVYIAESMRLGVTMYEINPKDYSLSFHKFFDTKTVPDNLFIDEQDGSLWIGCHPSPLSFARHSIVKEHKHAPYAPSQVIRLSADLTSIEQILMSNGEDLSASSAAGRVNGKLLVTPVFDDHVLLCSPAN